MAVRRHGKVWRDGIVCAGMLLLSLAGTVYLILLQRERTKLDPIVRQDHRRPAAVRTFSAQDLGSAFRYEISYRYTDDGNEYAGQVNFDRPKSTEAAADQVRMGRTVLRTEATFEVFIDSTDPGRNVPEFYARPLGNIRGPLFGVTMLWLITAFRIWYTWRQRRRS